MAPERKAFEQAGKALGFGLRNLFALMDPMPIAIVGIGATAFDLTRHLSKMLSEHLQRLQSYPQLFVLIMMKR